MKLNHCARAAGALAVLALVVPASASAVPGVYSVVAKVGDPGVVFPDPLTTTQTQYTVTTDGYAVAFAEDNGVAGGGVLNYKELPTAYRAPMTAEQKRTFPDAQTDVQAHATCSGVTALTDGANILAWQGADPQYNYIPWQKTAAGLGDDPAKWIPVVKTATGVDLSTVTDYTAACTKLGGTYHPADTASAVADSLIANAVAPFQKQVADLKAQVASLTKAKATADAALVTEKAARKEVETAYQAQFDRPVFVTPASKRIGPKNGVALLVTGSTGDPVTLTLELTKKQAKRLGLRDRVLAETTREFDSQGATIATLKPGKAAAKALKKHHKRSLPVTILAVSGGHEDSAKATLAR